MKDYLCVLEELNNFPSGKELFPYKRYNTHEEMWAELNMPPIKSNGYLKDFQEACRSLEWKASNVVIEKYKRQYEINSQDLIIYITNFSKERELSGKKVHKDILIQEASRYIKENCNKKEMKYGN